VARSRLTTPVSSRCRCRDDDPASDHHDLVVDRGAERGLRRRLAALARIALTGYLLQSILAVVVFFGFGAYGRTALLGEPILGMLAFVIGAWIVLLAFAPWWTSCFRAGPFEWLWRWGTCAVRPRMRA
jgi:uncharacterized membrane protein YeiB